MPFSLSEADIAIVKKAQHCLSRLTSTTLILVPYHILINTQHYTIYVLICA